MTQAFVSIAFRSVSARPVLSKSFLKLSATNRPPRSSTRLQLELFGTREGIRRERYSGMIPAHLIVDRTLKPGVADCIDTAWVEHVEKHHGAPATSTVQFKSYDQGRLAFQGTSKHLIWLDEEPPDSTDGPT